MKQRTKDVLFIVLLASVIIFMIFTTAYIIKNKRAFFDHPLKYYAEKRDMNCDCICGNTNLVFNSTTVTFKKADFLDNIYNAN